MEDERKKFIREFVDKGRAQNLPPSEIDSKLSSALQDFDHQRSGGILELPEKVSDVILGGAKNVARDIGASLPAADINKTDTQLEQTASQAETMSRRAKTPDERRRWDSIAQNSREQIRRNSQTVTTAFSPDIEKNYLQRGLTAGSQIAATAELPELGLSLGKNLVKGGMKIGKVISEFPEHITKGVTWQRMVDAAKRGKDIDWNTVENTARTFAENKASSVKRALEQVMSEEAPTARAGTYTQDIIKNRAISSPEALELRGELGSRLSKDVFGRLKIPTSSANQQANDILRRTISSLLKEAAPDIRTPDKWYSFYSRIHGDAPTWAKRAIIAHIASQVLPKNIRGTATDIAGAVGETLLGF